MPGPAPTCECGTCRLCVMRKVSRRYYDRHTDEVKRKTSEAKRARRGLSPEVSDEELDRRALVLMGRMQDAR